MNNCEPVEYQYRTRPMWVEEGTGWYDWRKCSRGEYEDYLRLPVYNDWQYEVRALYLAPVEQITPTWIDGAPPKPYSEEWFIARTIHRDRVVLRALPEEYNYDFTTADATYIKRENIKQWMQFPDSQFLAAPVIKWISVKDRLPEVETPVLVQYNGTHRIGELRWERPGFEDTFTAFQYWDCPYNDGQDWDFDLVTHWMPLPTAIKESA